MLSSTHAIFRGLQEHIQQIYHDLPLSTPPRIKTGLLDTHQKLSDYYYKYDQSPFYTWAAHKFLDSDLQILLTTMIYFSVLYPHISHEGAKEDYADDADLLEYLESAKELLHTHYTKLYANRARSTQETTDAHVPTVTNDSPSKVNFTLRYKKKENLLRDKLEEYFKLPCEDFDTCQPLQWWVGRQSQFPSLYCLARDVFSIPGTFSNSLVHIKR